MLRLMKFLKKLDWLLAAVCLALVVGQVWLDLRLPDYTSDITRLVVTEGSAMKDIWAAGGKMLLCALGSAAMAVATGYLASRIAADFGYAVSDGLFSKVSDFGEGEIKKFSTASLITRTTNDITQIQMVLGLGLAVLLRAPIMAVWAVLKIVGKSWQLSMVVAVAVIVLVLSLVVILSVVVPKFRIVQKQVDDVNRVGRENLTGLRVVRAFNAEGAQERKFDAVNDALTRTQLFTGRWMAALMPLMSAVMSGLSLAIYWVGAKLVNDVAVTGIESVEQRVTLFSDVVVFSSYAIYVIMSFLMLVIIFMILPRAQASARRIREVLSCPVSVREGAAEDAPETGTIEFRDVSFRYPDAAEDCLKHISFRAEKGETVAFIGATGCGKSTLLALAERLYDATEGSVLVDGRDVRDYSFRALYGRLGCVPQKAVLFSDSVRENIAFGRSAQSVTDADVQKALEIAQGAEFVGAMPDGADSLLAEGGANISGGQKQRLAIARAVARRPEILLFDDSFSALDYRTDAELRRRLERDLKGTTCLVVAQRIGTIQHADRIIVLEDGAVAGTGTHAELLKTCPIYREIALSQLSSAELDA